VESNIGIRGPTGALQGWARILSGRTDGRYDVRVEMTRENGVSRVVVENAGVRNGAALVVSGQTGEATFNRIGSGILSELASNNADVKALAEFVNDRGGENKGFDYVSLSKDGKITDALVKGDTINFAQDRADREAAQITAGGAGEAGAYKAVRSDIGRMVDRIRKLIPTCMGVRAEDLKDRFAWVFAHTNAIKRCVRGEHHHPTVVGRSSATRYQRAICQGVSQDLCQRTPVINHASVEDHLAFTG
jgi:hypothetical protein